MRAIGITKTFPGMTRPALHDVTIGAGPGELLDLMGPSGSGKSTLVTIINGLTRPDAGRVVIGGEDVTDRAPSRRPTTTMFQQDNLFPEMSVAGNVAHPLRLAGASPTHVRDQTEVMLLRLGLAGVSDALPRHLSGGQRRRVALARALVSRPAVLLLDEPLSGLEQGLKAGLLELIDQMRRRLGMTVIHVTHDTPLALATADRIIVLDRGRIADEGAPRDVYQRPTSSFVASFLGASSFLDVRVIGPGDSASTRRVDVLGTAMTVAGPATVPTAAGREATLLVRPNALSVVPASGTTTVMGQPEPSGMLGIVQRRLYRGERMEYLVETERGSVLGTGDLWGPALERHEPARLVLHPERLWLLPR